VIATTSRALPFSSVFLNIAPTIRSRSVAASITEGQHCVISLAKNGVGINATGNAIVNLGCGVSSNSVGSTSIDLTGTSFLGATPLSTVGGINYAPSNIDPDTELVTYSVEQEDPIASLGLSVPASPAACAANNYTLNPNNSATIGPGRYCSGITVRGDLIMSPGVYIIDRGDFDVGSQGTVSGEGVTIILTGSTPSNVAAIKIVAGSEVDLRAPTAIEDPTWKNILFYQDPIADYPLSTMAGNSDFNMEGVIYMPKGDLRFTGSSGQHADCLLLIANRVNFVGDSSLDNNCPTDYDDLDTNVHRVRVVE